MLRRNRPDGTRVADLSPVRRMMPHLMPRRADAVVYFQHRIDLTATEAWLARWNACPDRPRLTLFHLLIAALARTLHERPKMNRFVAGRRLWQRRGVEISVSVIKAREDDARLTVVKQRFEPGEGLLACRARLEAAMARGRAPRETASEREVALVTRLPGALARGLVVLQRLADSWNLLPGVLIRNDPLYASAMVSNLGSIGVDAAWHHLYEHGTLSIFLNVGRAAPVPVAAEDGTLSVRRCLTVNYAFDERVADGYYAARSLDLFQRLVESPDLLETAADRDAVSPG